MNWNNEEFKEGIQNFMKEAGVEEDLQPQFEELVLNEMSESLNQMKAAADMGQVKEASVEDPQLSDLDRILIKSAFEKSAVIRQESCTDSDGNEGSYVLYDSEGQKQLGCHKSREAAEAQERAIQAQKRGSTRKT